MVEFVIGIYSLILISGIIFFAKIESDHRNKQQELIEKLHFVEETNTDENK